MSIKLRNLIRAVRAAKTAGEERAVITKESACIRSAFKGDTGSQSSYRHRNVAKLLYIHMLGYPSQFGQMEVLKLIASANFAEKRIGYLALGMLLDESTEVLTLVQNCLKTDLRHRNKFVVGLALTALGNIASTDITRDLASEVDCHLKNTNPYIRKKAALCAKRIFVKVPELVEDFVERVLHLLADRNHGVLYTGVQLIAHLLENFSEEYRKRFQKPSVVKKLVKRLNSLSRSGYQPAYDVSGITDPFLQVGILRLMRLLGQGNKTLSDAMSDILAQVATNTESTKSTGNAILYECVMTIMAIEAEDGLRVLAVNLLGRFLLNSDNNIRYVALNTLCKVVERDVAAVNRHKNTIIECLKDPDVSIRRRAMELIYSLVNKQNIRLLAREMLNYLVVAEKEDRADLCSRITDSINKFAPSPRWQIDTFLTMLSIAGEHVGNSITSDVIHLICHNPALHSYVVHKLFRLLRADMTQIALTEVGIWTFGEFGDKLLSDCTEATSAAVSEKEVIDLLSKAMSVYFATPKMKAMVMTALLKLSTRFSTATKRVARLIKTFKQSLGLELQQRSCEYSMVLSDQFTDIRPAVLAPMPLATPKTTNQASVSVTAVTGGQTDLDLGSPAPEADSTDLLGDIFGLGTGSPAPASSPASAPSGGGGSLMDELFGGGGSPAPTMPAAASPPGGNALSAIDDLFGPSPAAAGGAGGGGDMLGGLTAAPPIPQANPYPDIVAFSGNGIEVKIAFAKPDGPDSPRVSMTITSTNSSGANVSNFLIAAAVPKYLSEVPLQWGVASGTALAPFGGNSIVQDLTLVNSMHGKRKILMRMKIDFQSNGAQKTELVKVDNFPDNL